MNPQSTTAPHVIVMVGIPGAGKTTFAEHFAQTFQAPVVSTDKLALIAQSDPEVSTRLALYQLSELLKTRRTIVYEGPTDTKVSRVALTKQITDAGYTPLLVWVQTESAESMRRATRKGGITVDEFERAIKRFTPPTAAEKPVVISGRHTYTTQLKIVLKNLAGQQRIEPAVAPRPSRGRNIILR